MMDETKLVDIFLVFPSLQDVEHLTMDKIGEHPQKEKGGDHSQKENGQKNRHRGRGRRQKYHGANGHGMKLRPMLLCCLCHLYLMVFLYEIILP